MELEARAQYNYLKDTGVLQELVEDMTGNWDKDKSLFMQYFEMNQNI